MTLDAAERRALLALARATIRDELLRDGALREALARLTRTAAIEQGRGVFVTLRGRSGPPPGPLRGCIGSLSEEQALYRGVIDAARSAAFHDPRFPALTRSELDAVRIEISTLTPPEPLSDPRDIVLGRDGVQLSCGTRRAVFLPQVALEQRWSVEELLEHLARKAGLDAGAWRESRLEVFRAEVFGEDDAN